MRSVIIGAIAALIISIAVTPLAIKLLTRAHQPVRNELGLASNAGKQRTPTMGGLVFIGATLLAYGIGHVALLPLQGRPHLPTLTGLVLLGLFVGAGLIGLLDDVLKVVKRHPGGLPGRYKIVGQLLVGAGFGALALYFPSPEHYTVGSENVSFVRDIPWANIGRIGAVVVFVLMVMATSNAVNLTDGLDGLATGSSAIVLSAYVLIAFWQYRHWCAERPKFSACYEVRDPLEVALVAAAAAGALIGFLWWNTSPARIIMGDVGALGLGSLIAGLAMATHTMLLLPIICGLFVFVTSSRIIQYVSFKTTGKRVFRMSPIHHHFEMAGWSEVTIVVRFWLLAAVAAALAVGLFFADFIHRAGF
ncbi:MAG TPA: phospho-N-acetylmuramoyl-pentapeptide-transferase [Stackebrandtia sp.]|jgi:phospho-N-acetylmuramoyl-pentapeptide-transferase|uniref:phospho-N-acetylmuramoyl-pentapeptide- transferase n=1 Tax=Stackebrandtia sp. TaxID=2023065 RepID=UPI002D5665F4|nr:phospho-N-acetylmuramoyl-pentapeptide-transferase [Stackebrandtia sp.]HZE40205.1 phospho-N-acetylmuramoyl-pentapeptide-transferase [Stackebrandtia sp.]